MDIANVINKLTNFVNNPTDEISKLEVKDIVNLFLEIRALNNYAKRVSKSFEDALNFRFSFEDAEKDGSSMRLFSDEFELVAEVSEKRRWDQDELEKILKDDERLKNFVKTTYSIPKKSYSALTEDDKRLFEKALIIEDGKTKLSLEKFKSPGKKCTTEGITENEEEGGVNE